MSKITTCLWFDKGQAREAAEFYAGVFPDSHVATALASPADNPSTRRGEEITVEFTLLGQSFVGLNGGPMYQPSEAVSFQVFTDTQEETDRYWNAIVGHGGAESMCSWCKDRWGFSWQIVPRALMAGMADPDPRGGEARDGGDDDDAKDRHRRDRGGARGGDGRCVS